MDDDRKSQILEEIPRVLKEGPLSKSELMAKLGLAGGQWMTIRKLAGKKLKMNGSKINARYTWEG